MNPASRSPKSTRRLRLQFAGHLAAIAVSSQADQKLADFRRVIVPDKPLPVQQAAATELAAYAGRLAGSPLEILTASNYTPSATGLSFFVGDAARLALPADPAPWQEEEWMLRTVSNGLVVAGDDGPGDAWSLTTRAGSMLAAYTLLDDVLGVRWFWPGPSGEHVPSRPDAVIPALDRRAAPAFMIRSIKLGYPIYHSPAFGEAADRWARRNRLGWTRSAVFGHSWLDAFLRPAYSNTLAAHPEWLALTDGKRRGPQMCTTQPGVIDRMVEYVLTGKQAIMNISPSDGGGFCQCSNCTALDVPGLMTPNGPPVISDRIFTYANEVARRVREKNPAKGCGMFAYTYYNSPPLRIPKLEPNLYLSFVYQSASFRDPACLAQWRDSVAGWQKLGARMVVREGWGNHYALDLPWIHTDQIMANLAESARLGFIAAYGEGSKSFATQAPNHWALTRMMWDPARATNGLMEAFYTDAYGPAAAQMKAFFDTYRNALDANWPRRRFVRPDPGLSYANTINSWHLVLPSNVVAEAEKHLAAAEALAPKGEYADRLALHRLGQDYTRTMLELLDCYRRLNELGVTMDEFARENPVPVTDPAEIKRLLQRAYELGEKREQLLLAHRDEPGPDEGLYAMTVDRRLRPWHATVKKELGIKEPSGVTGEILKPKPH